MILTGLGESMDWKNKRGYTLIELTIVMALMLVLFTMLSVGVLSFLNHSEKTHNDEYAKIIFSSVQNALIDKKNNGSLLELRDDIMANCDGVPLPIYKGGVISNEVRDMYSRLFAINIGPNKVTERDEKAREILKDLVSDRMYDSEMWKGAVCVELDPSDGVVKAVWYSKTGKELSYSREDLENRVIKIGDFTKDFKESAIGYYGVDELSDSIPVDLGRPKVENAKITNGDVLDISWNLDNEFAFYVRKLDYEINIFNESNKPLINLIIDGENLQIGSQSEMKFIDAKISTYDSSGNLTSSGESIPVLSYIGRNKNDIHIVLDAIDLNAENVINQFRSDKTNVDYVQKLKKSTSIMKFVELYNFDIKGQIKAEIKASDLSSSSDTKVTNLASVIANKVEGEKVFEISNARHLFNIRFIENSFSGIEGITYNQVEDFEWGKKDFIFNTLEGSTNTYKFTPIEKLNSKHSYNGNNKKIENLVISEDRNEVALFRENSGSISNIVIEKAVVYGKENVAILCAKNNGEIKNIVTSGNVSGEKYVAGIIATTSGGNRKYSELKNDANVTGYEFVGGVISDLKDCEVENSSNTGLVRGLKKEGVTSQYIGGITGYSDSSVIKNCVVEPSQDNFKLPENILDYMVGNNVGGVAGYSKNSSFENCENKGGYVFGESYVGGIIGRAEGELVLNGNGKENNSTVVGSQYVGGIISEINEKSSLKNWVNKGLVFSTNGYCGGIAGFNKGKVENCYVKMDNHEDGLVEKREENKAFYYYLTENKVSLSEITKEADYVGGVVGYNGGEVLIESEILSPIVIGRNYLGGVVGYNLGKVSLKNVTEPIISGSNFIGGVFGFNGDINSINGIKISNLDINSNDGNFVGGYIGGNIISSLNSKDVENENLTISGGNIKAKGNYVAGVIGYNSVVEEKDIEAYVKNILSAIKDGKEFDEKSVNSGSMIFKNAKINVDSVEGGRFVGGIIGKNTDNTHTILNKINGEIGKIKGNDFIEVEGKKHSFTSSISGMISKNMIVEEVSIKANVESYSNVTGNFAEINEGQILNCIIEGDINKGVYAGGIVGINKGIISNSRYNGNVLTNAGISYINYGRIESPEVKNGVIVYRNESGALITGNVLVESEIVNGENAGSIAYRNSGEIKDITFGGKASIFTLFKNGKISVDGGGYTGGIVGVNEDYGSIENVILEKEITLVSQNAKAVGGLVGANYGRIKNININDNIYFYVSNKDCILGGLVGLNVGSESDENLGLIEGNEENKSVVNVKIDSECNVIGGVVGSNSGRIRNIVFAGKINGRANVIGGIAGKNDGHIESCFVESLESSRDSIKNLSESNVSSTGGIAGENTLNGLIEKATVLRGNINSESGQVGGVVGLNYGEVTSCYAEEEEKENSSKEKNVSIYSANGYAGGIAGKNEIEATITLSSTGEDWEVKAEGSSSGVGGIVGYNCSEYSIESVSNYASVNGDVNVGGVVGYNNNNTTKSYGVRGCVNYGDVFGRQNVGGITGSVNVGFNDKEIEGKITFAFCENYGNVTNKTNYTGGIVGYINSSHNDNIVFEVCKNFGEVGNKDGANVGGILGGNDEGNDLSKVIFYNNVNAGIINGGFNYGGIAGYVSGDTVQVEGNVNYYNFNGKDGFGGIVCSGVNAEYRNNININSKNFVTNGYQSDGGTNLYFGESIESTENIPNVVNVREKIKASYESENVKLLWDNLYGLENEAFTVSSENISGFKFSIDTKTENGGSTIENIAIATQSEVDKFKYYDFNVMLKDIDGNKLYLNKDGELVDEIPDEALRISIEEYDNIKWGIFKLKEAKERIVEVEITVLGVNVKASEKDKMEKSNLIVINEISLNRGENSQENMLTLYRNGDTYVGINQNQGVAIYDILYNPNDNEHKNYDAKMYYEDIDNAIQSYFRSQFSSVALESQNIILTRYDNGYKLNWDKAQGGYAYLVEVYTYNDNEWVLRKQQEVRYGTEYRFKAERKWLNDGASSIMCKVKTTNGLYEKGRALGENGQFISNAGKSNIIGIGELLPSPEISFELINEKGGYVISLLNAKEYKDLEKENIDIYLNINGVGAKFKVGGNIKFEYNKDEDLSLNVIAQARISNNEKYMNSISISKQLNLYSVKSLASNRFSEIEKGSYFTGDNPLELKFNGSIKSKENVLNTRYNEILYNGVVYGYDEMRESERNDFVIANLEEIPANSKVIFRSYLAGDMNMGVSYGHKVLEKAKYEDVQKYINQSGYVVRKNKDYYDVYYNVLLANKGKFGKQILEKEVVLPKGLEKVNLNDDYDLSNGLYKFSFSDNGSGKYKVRISGKNAGFENKVLFDEITENKQILVNGKDWIFDSLVVEVAKIGKESIITENMGSYVKKEYNFKYSLPEIKVIDVKRLDGYNYNVSFNGYVDGSEEFNQAKGYSIRVYGKAENVGWYVVGSLIDKNQSSASVDLSSFKNQDIKVGVFAIVDEKARSERFKSNSIIKEVYDVKVEEEVKLGKVSIELKPYTYISEFENGIVLKFDVLENDESGKYVISGNVLDGQTLVYSFEEEEVINGECYLKNVPINALNKELKVRYKFIKENGKSSEESKEISIKLPKAKLDTLKVIADEKGLSIEKGKYVISYNIILKSKDGRRKEVDIDLSSKKVIVDGMEIKKLSSVLDKNVYSIDKGKTDINLEFLEDKIMILPLENVESIEVSANSLDDSIEKTDVFVWKK